MAGVFISYSRKDRDVAGRLHRALTERGKDVWIDLEDIPPSAEWMKRITDAIDASNAIVFLLSEHSVSSRVCEQEVGHAAGRQKRLIPVSLGVVDPSKVPETLQKLNWINLDATTAFDDSVALLIEAIDTDLAHVDLHTRLLVRAADWEQHGKDASYLLRGSDLREAERWLQAAFGKSPQPSLLQIQYIQDSSQQQRRRQKILVYSSMAAVAVSASIAAYAASQREVAQAESMRALQKQSDAERSSALAQQRSVIALGRQLAAQAENLPSQGPKMVPRAALLAIESLRREYSSDTDRAARKTLRLIPRTLGVYRFGDDDSPRFLALTPDGSFGIATMVSGRAVVFEVTTGRTIDVIQSEGATLPSVVSADGRFIAARGMKATIWDTVNRKSVQHLAEDLWDANFSTDGHRLIVSHLDGQVVIYALEPWKELGRVRLPAAPAFVQDSRDGATLVALVQANKRPARDAMIIVADLASFAVTRTLTCQPAGEWLAIAPGTGVALEGAWSGSGRIWDCATGKVVGSFPALSQEADTRITFSADGSALILADDTRAIRLLQAKSGEPRTVGRFREAIGNIAVSADATRVAGCGYDDTARVWDAASGREIARETHGDYVVGLALSADGSVMITSQLVGGMGTVVVASAIADWAEVQAVKHGDLFEPTVSWSEDGSLLEVRTEEKRQVWDAISGSASGSTTVVSHAAAAPTDVPAWLASAGISAKEAGLTLEEDKIIVSPGGRYLVEMTPHFVVRVLDAMARGKEIVRAVHEANLPRVAAFSADATLIATSSHDSIRSGCLLQIHELPSGRERVNLDLPWGTWSMSFSPDGKRLAVASVDGLTRIYRTTREGLIEELAARLRRNLTREEWRRYLPGVDYAPTIEGLPTPVGSQVLIGEFESYPTAYTAPDPPE